MPTTSNRVLVDRSVVRLDGRPFFAFGPRLLLTPASRLAERLAEIADLGFTAVASPPCSPGTLPLIDNFFDEAERAGLMVLLLADPRLPHHSGYIADQYRERNSLLAYQLPTREGAGTQQLDDWLAERDAVRSADLFHPIFMPVNLLHLRSDWLRAQDIFVPMTDESERHPGPRVPQQHPGQPLEEMMHAANRLPPRPSYCTDLRVTPSTRERRAGLWSDEPDVANYPNDPLQWFPWLSTLEFLKRQDLLPPDPELLRLQVYDLLGSGVRGIFLDFHEALLGSPPYSGRDRLCEAAILAQEIAVLHDFFAEGRPEPAAEVESGHPRLSARVIRHGLELLIVLRMEGYEEDFFIDEATMERAEVSLKLDGATGLSAWRMDFPTPHRLEMLRDSHGSMRFKVGPLELTGLILLSPGAQRCEELASHMSQRLGGVAQLAIEEAEVRIAKVEMIEDQLRRLRAGTMKTSRMAEARELLDAARELQKNDQYAEAWTKARGTMKVLRVLIKYQMAKALATPLFDKGSFAHKLLGSYFTLPRFYRESHNESTRAFTEIT